MNQAASGGDSGSAGNRLSTLVRKSAMKRIDSKSRVTIKRRVNYAESDNSSDGSDTTTLSRNDSLMSSGSSFSTDSSPSLSRRSTPPSTLDIPTLTRYQDHECLSPSKQWQDHIKEASHGTKFLNIVDNEEVSAKDGDKQLNLLADEYWLNRWRKLSNESEDHDYVNGWVVSDLVFSGSDEDVIDGGGMSRMKHRQADASKSDSRGVAKDIIVEENNADVEPVALRTKNQDSLGVGKYERQQSSFYACTPDDEDAYDNVPWSPDTYSEMMQSDKSPATECAAGYNNNDALPPREHKTLSNTSSHLSNTDSGIGSERGNSLSGAENELEDIEAKFEHFLSDLSESTLNKMDKSMDSGSKNSSVICVEKMRRTRGIRTKKTRGGAMNALKEMETKNVDPQKRYILGDMLGQGAFGTVYIARDNDTDEVVAVKIVSLQQGQKQLGLIVKELEALITLEHPNIINYRGSYRIDQTLWIVMDYLEGGSLTSVVETMELDEVCIATITAECLKALSYLHSKRIIHRDIKSDNILMGSGGEVKLTDFGCCAQLHTTDAKRQTTIGTPYWMSPEAIQGKPYNEKADIWSIGVLMVEMIDGTPPYMKYPAHKACQMILKQKGMPTIKRKISPNLDNFVKKCFHRKVHKRPSVDELLQHPFIVDNAVHYSQLEPLMKAVLEVVYYSDEETEESNQVTAC